jgi:hypothetical protein
MPQIETWSRLPAAVRDHLVEPMHDRNISLEDLNQLRVWIEARPMVPDRPWYKDFGSFKLCGEGKFPKTFLLPGQAAKGLPCDIQPCHPQPHLSDHGDEVLPRHVVPVVHNRATEMPEDKPENSHENHLECWIHDGKIN